jgi:hypothetical protein
VLRDADRTLAKNMFRSIEDDTQDICSKAVAHFKIRKSHFKCQCMDFQFILWSLRFTDPNNDDLKNNISGAERASEGAFPG